MLWSLFVSAQTGNPQQLFEEAVAAQERGDDMLAIHKYRELLRAHPEAIAVRVNLGATLAHQKHYGEAIEQYRMVLAKDRANGMARMNLAQAYQANGNVTDAIRELNQLHQQDPDQGEAVMLLADCYLQTARFSDVVSLLEPYESGQPDNLDLQLLLGKGLIHAGRAAEGVSRVEKVAAKSANAEAYLLAGQTRLNMNQFDLARRDVDAAQHLNAKLAGLQTLNGMILEQTADYDGAEGALQTALASNPDDFDARYYLGAIFYFKRDMEKAKFQLTRALALQPNSTQVKYELALVARADGHLDEALKFLQSVVRDSPDWLQPHVELSAVYYRLQRPVDGAKEKGIVDHMMATQQQHQPQAPR